MYLPKVKAFAPVILFLSIYVQNCIYKDVHAALFKIPSNKNSNNLKKLLNVYLFIINTNNIYLERIYYVSDIVLGLSLHCFISGIVIISNSQMRNLRYREVKLLVQVT